MTVNRSPPNGGLFIKIYPYLIKRGNFKKRIGCPLSGQLTINVKR